MVSIGKIPCTVEVLTLNSGKTLRACLESVKDFNDTIILDGNSTDDTLAIAKEYGARIYPQKESTEKNIRIEDFSEIRNKGVALAKNKWFTFVDSDEYLSKEAVSEIRDIVAKGENKKQLAFRRPRKFVLNGNVIERAATYPNYQIRFFYLPATLGFIKKVHEKIKLKPGILVGNLVYPEYVPLVPLSVARNKWNRYLDIEQEIFREISLHRLAKGVWSNTLKTLKYTVKYFWVMITQKGKAMPFAYEYYGAVYHMQLIYRMMKAYILKITR